MKNRKCFIKRIMTWLAIGTSLLAGALIVLGIAVRGPAGLNLFAWGLVLAPLAVGVIILRICLPFLFWKSSISSKTIPKGILKNDSPILSGRFKFIPVFNDASSMLDNHDDSDKETPAFADPRNSISANFNWGTGEYDVARGMDGLYDPPYDLIKK